MPFNPRRIRASFAALVCVGLLSSPLLAQEKHELKMNIREGQTWSFDSKSNMAMNINAVANGQVVQKAEQGGGQRRVGSLQVLAAKDGQPTALKVEFGKDCSNLVNANGQKQEPPFALAGKTVTLKMGADGTVTHDAPAGTDEAAVEEAKAMLKADVGILPKKPVAVGDEWEPDNATMVKQFQLAPTDKLTVTCKLLKIGEAGARKTADISITGKIGKAEGPATITITLGGVSQVDLLTGQPLQTDIIGKIGVTGGTDVPGPNGQPVKLDLSGDGTLEVHQTAKLADGPAPVVDGPVPPPQPPVPPVVPAGDAKAYAGTFSGEGLTVELAPAGDGLKGTIALGEKKFPATATVAGGKLTGSFESGASKFDFTASADGDTLTLTTGTTKYTLKKADENPLLKPAPKNPLVQ